MSVEDTVRTLRERARREQQQREAHAAATRVAVEEAVRTHLPEQGRAWLIGSLAWGGFGERSDVDLVLSGVGSAQATEIEDAVVQAAGTAVDVLELEELPASFRARVESEGCALHGR